MAKPHQTKIYQSALSRLKYSRYRRKAPNVERAKWTLSENQDNEAELLLATEDGISRAWLLDLLRNRALTAHFQPLFSARSGEVYGYEALARVQSDWPLPDGKPIDIGTLFRRAGEVGLLPQLDVMCREIAIRQAAHLGLQNSNAFLFINICPIILTDPNHKVGATDALVEELGFCKDRIVFELTEEVAVQDYKLFRLAVAYYRDQGYKIAIDDFGVGYGGLKMLSMIEPDFVKIDRHFISNIDRALVRFNLVDMISTACHRMGIRVVAEGVEREAELEVLMDMGIELLQGFGLGRPAPTLHLEKCCSAGVHLRRKNETTAPSELKFIGQIAREVTGVAPQTNLGQVFERFIGDGNLLSLPLVESERVVGLLQRHRFLEKDFLGRFGYAHLLNSTKAAIDLSSSRTFLSVEFNCTLEEVAQRITMRGADVLYDDICVSQNGKYCGVVAVNALLEALTQRSLLLAQGTNPLTKLPGNEFIQREIDTRIAQKMHFDVCYVDLDFFKPFNDHYGFEKGDVVIQTLARLLVESVNATRLSPFSFVGHIGGDDFIVVCRPQTSLEMAGTLRDDFAAQLPKFHGATDFAQGKYNSKNRRGEAEEFPLLSLSIAIVSSEVHKIESYAQLASVAAEVKKAAKAQPGTSIVRDRRLMEAPLQNISPMHHFVASRPFALNV